MTAPVLHIEGIEGIEYEELREELPAGVLSPPVEPVRATDEYGEVVLVSAVVVATAAALNAFSAWLSRRRREDPSTSVTVTTRPDGSVTIRIGTGGSTDVPADTDGIASALRDVLDAGASG